MTKAGVYDIAADTSVLIITDSETDVTANYEIITEKGTLTVRDRAPEARSHSRSYT